MKLAISGTVLLLATSLEVCANEDALQEPTLGQVSAEVRDYHIDTDEWFTSAKMLIGSDSAIADLEVVLNSDIFMVTEASCTDCRSRPYDVLKSTTVKDSPRKDASYGFRKSKFTQYSELKGDFVKD